MAEFAANCGLSSSAFGEKDAVPSDETGGKGQCEVSVSNGDCGLSSDMVVSAIPDSEELETANTSVLEAGIPRRTSIIKVRLVKAHVWKTGACLQNTVSQYLRNLLMSPTCFTVDSNNMFITISLTSPSLGCR